MTEVVKLQPDAPNLETHAKNIRLFHDGSRRGAAELYGYAFLCGREMLLAKSLVPHGNKDPEGGFKKWIEERFKGDIEYRTAVRWMHFAEELGKSDTVSLFSAAPKLLNEGRLSEKDCEAVLNVVPQLMDGKSMTAFMRDSQLAKEPEKAGGYRPDLKALKKWLETNHPEHANTKWPDLPKELQDTFKKEHKPKIDPKLLAESKRQKADDLIADLTVMLENDEHKKFWSPEQRKQAKGLFWDFHQALVTLDKKAPKGKAAK